MHGAVGEEEDGAPAVAEVVADEAAVRIEEEERATCHVRIISSRATALTVPIATSATIVLSGTHKENVIPSWRPEVAGLGTDADTGTTIPRGLGKPPRVATTVPHHPRQAVDP